MVSAVVLIELITALSTNIVLKICTRFDLVASLLDYFNLFEFQSFEELIIFNRHHVLQQYW